MFNYTQRWKFNFKIYLDSLLVNALKEKGYNLKVEKFVFVNVDFPQSLLKIYGSLLKPIAGIRVF